MKWVDHWLHLYYNSSEKTAQVKVDPPSSYRIQPKRPSKTCNLTHPPRREDISVDRTEQGHGISLCDLTTGHRVSSPNTAAAPLMRSAQLPERHINDLFELSPELFSYVMDDSVRGSKQHLSRYYT